MRKLRIGLIGMGFMGQQHIEAIRRIPGTEVVALVENDQKTADYLGEQLDIPRIHNDYHDLLADSSIDVIHNCTPNSMHFQINEDIIRSGKHVYSEKPLTINSEQSARLLALCSEYSVASGVDFNYRQNAMIQAMKCRVTDGGFGRTLMLNGHYMQDWLMYNTDFTWRLVQSEGESRTVGDIGSHWFDLAQFVTGQKVTQVYAKFITVHPTRHCTIGRQITFSNDEPVETREVPVETEDVSFIMFKMADGTPGSLTLSQVCAGHKNDLTFNVSGSRYSMSWEQENPDKLHLGHRDKANELLYASPDALSGTYRRYAPLPVGHPVAWADSLRNGIQEFYTAIRNETYMEANQSYATFQDGHEIVKIVEACCKSNKEDRWIDV